MRLECSARSTAVKSLLGFLTLSCLAYADTRSDARRHFKAGMALISEKQYDEAIAELQQAYAIKPHPNVLFNIARAHESAGRLNEAIQFYQQYLETAPPDSGDVSIRIARLSALMPKPIAPPKEPPATPTAAPPVDTSPSEERQQILALQSKLEAAQLQLEKERQRAETALTEAAARQKGASENIELDGDADFGVPYEETVSAAARRVQSTLVAPNSVTVITGDEIRATGLRSIPEILRRIPGAEVMTMGASSENVSFRGFNQRASNKILVLIDGRTEYLDFIGSTLYAEIPISIDEIERIEVIRGPGSALYGANAVTGVINILTRAPGTGTPAEVKVLTGAGNTINASGVVSGGKRFKYRASAGYDQTDKYSLDYNRNRNDVRPAFAEPNLSLRSAKANVSLYYGFTNAVSMTLSGGVNRLKHEFFPPGTLRNFTTEGTAGYARADLTAGPLKTRFFWNHSDTENGPQFEVVGQSSLRAFIASNVFDLELLFQKDFSLGGQHQFAAGASGRVKRVSWNFIGGLIQEVHGAAFIQDEWRPFEALSVVGSLRIDRHPLLDKGNPGYAVSPRVAVVVKATEQHAFRANFTSAFRQPNFLESYLALLAPVPGVNGARILSLGNRQLRPERLLGGEIGYRGELATYGVTFDAAAYWYQVSDLIRLTSVTRSNVNQAISPAGDSFIFGRSEYDNDNATLSARGFEMGLTWNALNGFDLRTNVALQSITSNRSEVCPSCQQAPTAKVNLGIVYRTPVKIELSADVNYTSSSTWIEREPNPADPTQIADLSSPLPGFFVVNARIGYRFFDDHFSLGVVGSQLAPAHQEHPFGNLISQRVFLELGVKL